VGLDGNGERGNGGRGNGGGGGVRGNSGRENGNGGGRGIGNSGDVRGNGGESGNGEHGNGDGGERKNGGRGNGNSGGECVNGGGGGGTRGNVAPGGSSRISASGSPARDALGTPDRDAHGGAASLTKSGQYAAALKRFMAFVRSEPNALMGGSLLFALACLPVVTAGPAWLALCRYMHGRERGEGISWLGACALSFRTAGARAWLMGLSDMLALAMAGGCALVLLDGGMPAAALFAYSAMLMLDLVYLMSGIYRYPALCAEPTGRFGLLAARGFLMALANIGWTLMFSFAQLLALMVCALTGVGLLLLFPAASALLAVCAYDSMSKLYTLPAEPAGADMPKE
jgi:hypothetical protein